MFLFLAIFLAAHSMPRPSPSKGLLHWLRCPSPTSMAYAAKRLTLLACVAPHERAQSSQRMTQINPTDVPGLHPPFSKCLFCRKRQNPQILSAKCRKDDFDLLLWEPWNPPPLMASLPAAVREAPTGIFGGYPWALVQVFREGGKVV